MNYNQSSFTYTALLNILIFANFTVNLSFRIYYSPTFIANVIYVSTASCMIQ